jgi:hypothetical protein
MREIYFNNINKNYILNDKIILNDNFKKLFIGKNIDEINYQQFLNDNFKSNDISNQKYMFL